MFENANSKHTALQSEEWNLHADSSCRDLTNYQGTPLRLL